MVSQLILQMKNEFCGQKPDITDDNSTKQDKSCIFGGNFDMKPLKSENKMQMTNFRQTANFIWEIADLLRGDYKQSDYGKVILPLTVLRRLDCVLESTKEDVLSYLPRLEASKIQNIDPVLNKVAGHNFHNRSRYTFDSLIADPDHLAANMRNYINGFSESAREIIEYFDFDTQIDRLEKANLLFLVVKKFQEVDMHPDQMSNVEAGYLFEELIRKFSELSNETAGEHFTPREVIRLMVNLLFITDREVLTRPGIVKTLYDPAGGTGGMLTVAEEYVRELNPAARMELFGQEINPESYAIFKADMLIKGQNTGNVKFGNSFTEDGLPDHTFDYMLSNPPFGVSWRKVQKKIKDEHDDMGFSGRFGAGLPRVSDGSLLFLQHMISKMKTEDPGSRLAIVFNGSPLFTGGAGSGESEIRRWIIENDWLEAIIALPDQLFYNTGIATYVWVLDNRKVAERKGKIQLINAVDFYEKMSKSLGNKRNEITADQIREITQIYGDFEEGKYCKIFDNEDFGYQRIVVEQPQVDEDGEIVTTRQGEPRADTSLRDYENVPLKEDVEEYFRREVEPHLEDLPAQKPTSGEYCTYVLKCADGSFYKGQTKDFPKRMEQHQKGEVKWTSNNLPFEVIHWEVFDTRIEAVEREKYLKSGRGREWLKKQYREEKLKVFDRQAGAWIDHSKTRVGYEINFTRYFYEYTPLRSTAEIREDIRRLQDEMAGLTLKAIDL